MKKWLNRIRGALGTGLTWAAAWGGVGAILGLLGFLGPPFLGPPFMEPLGSLLAAVSFGVAGFIAGASFSTVLGITEGRRRFDEMSLPRFAGWGAVGGLLMSVLFLSNGSPLTLVGMLVTGVVTLMGAGSAAGSLALARRADDRELLEHGADVADIGLTEEEKRELLLGNRRLRSPGFASSWKAW